MPFVNRFTNTGEPTDSSGTAMSGSLAAGATFTSRWYEVDHGSHIGVGFYGSQALASSGLRIETSWDGSTPHNMYAADTASKSLTGGSKHCAELDAIVLAGYFRVIVENNASNAQSGAKVFVVALAP